MTRTTLIRAGIVFWTLLLVLPLCADSGATPGIFRGVLVEDPSGSQSAGFIYLRSRNGNVRRVEASKAVVAYDESVPKEKQTQGAQQALKPGADVRVTAEQQSDGEWHASRIDILGNENTTQNTQDTDDPDDDGYQLQPPGSHRPILRKS